MDKFPSILLLCFSFSISDSFFIWHNLKNIEFIYIILCKIDEPTISNISFQWSKLLGKKNLVKTSNSIFIQNTDPIGLFQYECSLWNNSHKLEKTVIDFKLERCKTICIRYKRLLIHSKRIVIDIVDLNKKNVSSSRQLLSLPTLSPAMNEPNILYYIIAVIVSIVIAIMIIILCIMCFEPYRRGGSEVSIEDESVQANIKSPPCADLLKVDAEDDTRVCNEYKKSAYNCKSGSRRTIYTIENMRLNELEGGNLCPIKGDSLPPINICPMKQKFRDTGPQQCQTCPSCPNVPPPYQRETLQNVEQQRPTAPPPIRVPLPYCVQAPICNPQFCHGPDPNANPMLYNYAQPLANSQYYGAPLPNYNPIFPKESDQFYLNAKPVNPRTFCNDPTHDEITQQLITYNDPLSVNRPIAFNNPSFNRPPICNDPLHDQSRKPSDNPSFNVAIPSHLREHSREVEISEGYNRGGDIGQNKVKQKSGLFCQKNMKQYSKNRIIEKRYQ